MTTKHDIPDTEYHADPAIGSTTAKLALKSLRLFRDHQLGMSRVEDKAHFRVGRLLHMQRLEPDRFADLHLAKGPVNEKTGKPYGRDTKAFADWQAANPDKTVLDPWFHLALERCPPEICDLFEGGVAESSVFVDDPATGLRIKCRPDYLRDRTIIDFKTCQDIDRVERDISRFGYWFSAAWYRHVVAIETEKAHRHRFVFLEKNAPFRWRIVDLAADYQMFADAKVSETLTNIHLAGKHDAWDDVGPFDVMVGMPDYLEETEDEDENQEEA